MIRNLYCLMLFLATLWFQGYAADSISIYVSPQGNDEAPASSGSPVKSLQRAAELVAESAGKKTVVVYLSGGIYALETALRLGPGHSGTTEAPIHWKALPGEEVCISGGVPVSGWKDEGDGSWSASLPDSYQGTFRSFYVNGKRATRARHPDQDYLRVRKAGNDKRTHFFFDKKELPKVMDLEGLELTLLHDWSVTRIGVKSIDWDSGRLDAIDSIGADLPFFTLTRWEKHARYFLENAPEFCDQAGEWYGDFKSGKIYYRPLPGEQMENCTGMIPLSKQLVVIQGSEDAHVSHVHFEGITFEHTAWTLPEKGYCGIQACMFTDRSAEKKGWSKAPAAIELNLADYCSFSRCTIRNTGATGIWIRRQCEGCVISESHIHGISGNGVSLGEGNDRLVGEQPWWKSAPDEVSRNNRISHSLIEECGEQFYGAVGVWCGLVAGTVIAHNEIRNLPYSGVSIGWVWTPEPTPCEKNTIHANHIHHILTTLSDGGGIYSLGLQPGSRITRNLIHDVQVNAGRAESNGMFLDEGTKELLIEHNIVFDIARSPLRFHKAHAPNAVWRNVLVCGEGIPPIRYNSTEETAIEKTRNIVLQEASMCDMKRLEELIADRRKELED